MATATGCSRHRLAPISPWEVVRRSIWLLCRSFGFCFTIQITRWNAGAQHHGILYTCGVRCLGRPRISLSAHRARPTADIMPTRSRHRPASAQADRGRCWRKDSVQATVGESRRACSRRRRFADRNVKPISPARRQFPALRNFPPNEPARPQRATRGIRARNRHSVRRDPRALVAVTTHDR